jgi:ABC-type sugar transport system ATPase subunit
VLNHPASALVAEFVGDPPMNVLAAQVTAHDERIWLRCDGFELSVLAGQSAALQAGQHEGVLVGIRPGDIQIDRAEIGAAALSSTLYAVEHLHRKSILSLQVGDRLLKAITDPGFEGKVGEQFWVTFPPDKLHLFDATTSQALPLA